MHRPPRSRPSAWLLVAAAAALAATLPGAGRAAAHASAIGYGHITLEGNQVTWSLLLDPWHLDTFMAVDADANADITAAEVAARHDEIVELVQPNLTATDSSDATPGTASVGEIAMVTMADTGLTGAGFTDLGDFPLVEVPVRFTFDHAVAPEHLVVSYGLFMQSGFGDHWSTARLDYGDESHTVRFTPEQPAFTQEAARAQDMEAGYDPDAVAFGETGAPAEPTGTDDAGGIGLPAVIFVAAGLALATALFFVQHRRRPASA